MKRLLFGLIYVTGVVATYMTIDSMEGGLREPVEKGAAVGASLAWPLTLPIALGAATGAAVGKGVEVASDLAGDLHRRR